MQPAYAIPPLTEAGVQKLIGVRCSFARKTNKAKVWWGKIEKVQFVNSTSCAVWIGAHGSAGHCRWHDLAHVRFTNHVDDPLKIAIHRAQLEARELGIAGPKTVRKAAAAPAAPSQPSPFENP